MNYMVRRTRSAIFGRCTIFLTTQIGLDSYAYGVQGEETIVDVPTFGASTMVKCINWAS